MSDSKQHVLARRDVLRILPAGIAATTLRGQHCATPAAPDAAHVPYQYQFFQPDEVNLLTTLMEGIIPADEHSPGAREARVADFADLMISSGPEYLKEDWRNALRLVAEDLKTQNANDWLQAMSEREADPQTVVEVFFRDLKHMTINGYYTSAIGIHQDLHYQGNTYVAEFKGCDHPEHAG